MKIITQCIYAKRGNPTLLKKLSRERDHFKNDLNSILTEWKWGDQPIKSASEFLTKMKPWIKSRNEEMEEKKAFLSKHKIKSLADIKAVKIKGG